MEVQERIELECSLQCELAIGVRLTWAELSANVAVDEHRLDRIEVAMGNGSDDRLLTTVLESHWRREQLAEHDVDDTAECGILQRVAAVCALVGYALGVRVENASVDGLVEVQLDASLGVADALDVEDGVAHSLGQQT